MGTAPAPKITAWLEADRCHVVQSHVCTDGKPLTTTLPWPVWYAVVRTGELNQSVHCLACGVHEYVRLSAPPEPATAP